MFSVAHLVGALASVHDYGCHVRAPWACGGTAGRQFVYRNILNDRHVQHPQPHLYVSSPLLVSEFSTDLVLRRG